MIGAHGGRLLGLVLKGGSSEVHAVRAAPRGPQGAVGLLRRSIVFLFLKLEGASLLSAQFRNAVGVWRPLLNLAASCQGLLFVGTIVGCLSL